MNATTDYSVALVYDFSMGKGGNLGESRTHDRDTAYEWEEIRKHTSEDSTWIVLENNVYDVTNFKKRHPGGFQIMEDHAGQDASVSCLFGYTKDQ